MSGETVYTVNDAAAHVSEAISLADAGFTERAHLQEWVIGNPTILGPDVIVVTSEMSQWINAAGNREADRLDVLGMDSSGQLVVAELKRGDAPDTVEMQAIKYAALASKFTMDTLAVHHAKFLTARGQGADVDEALSRLLEHAPELSDDTLSAPRIVLMASAFPAVVTNSVVYLRDVGLDISLLKFQAYRTYGGETIVTVSQLYPLPDVEDFTVAPKGIEQRKINVERSREARTVTRLVNAKAIENGKTFRLQSPNQRDGETVEALMNWIRETPDRGLVEWREHRSKPLVWAIDGETYSPSGLVSHLFELATGEVIRGIPGPLWWVDDDGHTLREIADAKA